jgi:hypothetical protein
MLGYCKIDGSHLDNNHSSVSQMSASVLVAGVTTNLYRDAGLTQVSIPLVLADFLCSPVRPLRTTQTQV